MRSLSPCLLVVALACARPPGEGVARAEPPDASTPAPDAPAGAPSCEPLLAARGLLMTSQRAKEPSKRAEARARASWAAAPAACRGGGWYVTAANLLRHAARIHEPLTAGDLRFETARDALAAGLAASPRDPELLAYVAYLARIAPAESPPLPAGACERVAPEPPSLGAYVCGAQAFAAGRFADADDQLAKITDARFPDLAELRARARAEARRPALPAPPAAPALRCDPFCPAEAWRAPARPE